MASGRAHDRATRLLCLPFGLLWWPWLGPAGAALAAGCFLFGGLWLSPDLDTASNPSHRWGPLAWVWRPYRRLLAHRSLLSHSPLLGTTLRLAYLGGFALLLAAVLEPLSGLGPARLLALAAGLWQQQRPLVLASLVSVEASSWLHLLQDGDPLPRTLRRRRHRQPRRSRSR